MLLSSASSYICSPHVGVEVQSSGGRFLSVVIYSSAMNFIYDSMQVSATSTSAKEYTLAETFRTALINSRPADLPSTVSVLAPQIL